MVSLVLHISPSLVKNNLPISQTPTTQACRYSRFWMNDFQGMHHYSQNHNSVSNRLDERVIQSI